MGQTLIEIAEKLRDAAQKVQLIYAFNGTGKTRLSREFKELIAPKNPEIEEGDSKIKIMYYNAFTEDLFYWNNDLIYDTDRKLIIQPNNYTRWILVEEGQEHNITEHFQRYTNDKLTPKYNQEYTIKDKNNNDVTIPEYSEVRFSFERGDDTDSKSIKISKGEESCFIWSVFYSLLEQTISVLNEPEEANRETDQFNDLQYVFIDDPVSSLDENHLIELAVNLAFLIKKSNGLKYVITTHSPLFFNVIYNELNLKSKKKATYLLEKNDDGSFELIEKKGDSNKCFSYHLFLKETIGEAIKSNTVQKYHFTLLRNLYEKTANFLGYPQWSDLLPGDRQLYYNRIIQFTSHSTLSNESFPEPTDPEKQTVKLLLDHLVNSKYWKEEIANATATPSISELPSTE